MSRGGATAGLDAGGGGSSSTDGERSGGGIDGNDGAIVSGVDSSATGSAEVSYIFGSLN